MKPVTVFHERTFTVVYVSAHGGKKGEQNLGGRFTKTPRAAAIKAASRICGASKIKGRCALNIIVKETTPGSMGKLFAYHILRTKVDKEVEHAGVTVLHAYTFKATAIPDPEALMAQKFVKKPTKKAVKKPTKKAVKKPKKEGEEDMFVMMGQKAPSSSKGQAQPAVAPFTEEEAIFQQIPIKQEGALFVQAPPVQTQKKKSQQMVSEDDFFLEEPIPALSQVAQQAIPTPQQKKVQQGAPQQKKAQQGVPVIPAPQQKKAQQGAPVIPAPQQKKVQQGVPAIPTPQQKKGGIFDFLFGEKKSV